MGDGIVLWRNNRKTKQLQGTETSENYDRLFYEGMQHVMKKSKKTL